MKSFFQRFQDSQPGAAKSRTKDPAYRQWISSKSDKDRAQLSDGVEQKTASSSKRLPTKTAGVRPPDVPGPLGRITSDNTTRFSTIPAASISRHLPPSLPLSQNHPLGSSISKVPNLKPPDEAREKPKPTTKRSEPVEVSGNEKDTTARVKSGRPSQSGQTTDPSSLQQHQFWRPSDTKVLNPEKEKKKERQKQREEIVGGDSRPPKNNDPDLKNERPDDYWTDRGEGGSRQRTEPKEVERGTKERRRDKAAESRKAEKWEQQERDLAQVREREARESERLKERKEKRREKGREKENEREREAQREVRDQDRAEERDKRKAEAKEQERAARERQDQELQAREHRERERKERRAKERQIEKERWERELLERMRREREKARERQQNEQKERERQRKEQKERERLQQEKWEREQEEIERKELQRLEKERLKEQEGVRHKEPEPQRQGFDPTTVDVLQMGRESQHQQKRERAREYEDRERRWRGDKFSENPVPVLGDTRTNDQDAPRSKSSKVRQEGMSDSEREQAKIRELGRRRTSRMLTQIDTPPKPDQRNVQDTEAPRSVEHSIKARGSKQNIYSNGGGDPSANRQHPKPTLRDEGYGSEFNPSAQNSPDPPGRDALLNAPPVQQVRLPSFSVDVPQFLGPPGHIISAQSQRSDLVTPIGHSSHPTPYPARPTFPDTSNQVRQSLKEVPELANRPAVPVLQAQLPVQQAQPPVPQTRPAAASSQVYDSGRTSSRPVVPSEMANLPSLGPPLTGAFPAPVHTHTSQENRPFPPTTTVQASYLSVPPFSRAPLNIPAESTPPLKGNNSTNVSAAPSPHEGHPVLPVAKSKSSRSNAQISPEPPPPETRPLPASHRADPNTLSGPSVQDRHAPTAIPQTIAPPVHGVSLSSSTQQSYQTNAATKNSPIPNPSYLLTNSGHPSAENTTHNDKGSSEPHSSRKELTHQVPPVQPVLPVTSVATASRSVAVNKRSSTMPPRYESYQDSIPPSVDPKAFNPSRPSPTYHVVKIQDTVPLTDFTKILQPNRADPRLRTSPHIDKISLQESAPPTSRRYHTDIYGHDSRTDRPLQPIVPPPLADESRNIASENKQRDPNLARKLPPTQTDNQDAIHSRHQRYYSEGDTAKHRGKSSPKSQPIEDVQILKAPQVPLVVESKQRGTQQSAVEPDANSRGPNVAFHDLTGGMTTDRKFPGAETQPSVTGMFQAHGVRLPQPSQGSDANGVSHLVSHYERIEQTAQLGGTIPRPATTVPRDTARVTTHEPPPQNNPSIGHFLSVPQIERPRTSNGVRPPTLNVQPSTSKPDRISRPDTSSSAQPPVTKAAPVEPRHDQVPYQTTGDGHPAPKKPRPNPVAQTAPRPSTADSSQGTSHRPRPDAPILSHKVSSSEGMAVKEPIGVFRVVTELNDGISNPPPSNETVKIAERSQPHRIFPINEDKAQARQHSNAREEPEVVYRHPAHPVPSQVYTDAMVRRDDTGDSVRDRAVIHSSTSSRQRKDSSPRIHSEDNSTKAQGAGEVATEDPRALQYRPNHSYGHPRASAPAIDARHTSQRTEPVQIEANRLASVPARKNISETNVMASQPDSSAQHPPSDERIRNKHSQGYYPQVPERSPEYVNPASISPQRTGNSGHSKLEEESRPRHHKGAVQVKDPRLADLLAPPKANDVAHHSYLRDARRTLASKLEREPNVSPNSVANNLNGGPEATLRLRSSSSRGEHSPRNVIVDSNPSGLSNTSPSHTQHPDLSAKDYSYVRVSPNASQHTPSPRSKPVLTEGHAGSQPEAQHGEDLRYGSGNLTSRQPLTRERAQDHVPNTEDTYSRKHDQTAPYTTRDVNARADDTKRISQIPSNSIPYTSEQRAEGTMTRRDGPQKDTYDVSQSVSIGNSRTRSESRNAQDISVYSRRPYTTSRETHNTPSSQTQTSPHVPTSNHVPSVPSSAPTIPAFGPSPDQIRPSRLPSSTQQAPTSKEAPTPPQPIQAPPMTSTPSKRNFIASLPPENPNSSSAPQPTTPRAYQIWLPPSSSTNDHDPARSTPAPSSRRHREQEREPRRDRDSMRHISSTVQQVLREAPLIPLQLAGPDSGTVNPYHYLKTRKIRTVSLMSTEAQDGAASTVIGSPTASILSQAPIYIPPEQDPIIAAREWTEAGAILPGQRVRRPGLVWAELDDTPPIQQVEHRRPEPRSSRSRRPRLPSSRSREASDTDQPSS